MEKKTGKKRVQHRVPMSEETKFHLHVLAEMRGCTMTALVESLVRQAVVESGKDDWKLACPMEKRVNLNRSECLNRKLEAYLVKHNTTLSDISKETGVDRGQLSRLFSGQRGLTESMRARLQPAFKVSLKSLGVVAKGRRKMGRTGKNGDIDKYLKAASKWM